MTTHDVVILGGGITGLGVARLAARNGLSVLLVERGDLASGTSSASSHMLHGGLRYLEQARFGLVRESLVERAAVARMAPSLAVPRRFIVPLYEGDRVGPLRLALGLTLYDALAGRRGFAPHAMLSAAEAVALEPGLAGSGLVGAGCYTDVVMDDARLAIAVARDAAAHGATLLTWHETVAVRALDGGGVELDVRDRLGADEQTVRGRVVVNATGPWSDAVREWLRPALGSRTRTGARVLSPSRGVHLVYPALTRAHGLVIVARSDGRVFFVVPFGEHSIVGTTEIALDDAVAPDAWSPSAAEVRYLRTEAGRVLVGGAETAPLAVFAGIRPLLRSGRGVGSTSREHRVFEDGPVLTIAGGKYTTFRVMARDVLSRVAPRRAIRDAEDPLPEPLPPGATVAEIAAFADGHEFARRVEDVIRRRSTLWLAPDRGRAAAVTVADVLARRLQWSDARRDEELSRFTSALDAETDLLKETP